jgi:hypothetical protein
MMETSFPRMNLPAQALVSTTTSWRCQALESEMVVWEIREGYVPWGVDEVKVKVLLVD